MINEIRAHLEHPAQLEKMYRTNKSSFKKAFSMLYPELKGDRLADSWNERLNYEGDEINWGSQRELLFVVIASFVAGVIAKLPAYLGISETFFYSRNIGFIIFPLLAAYFAWKNKLSIKQIFFIAGVILVSLIFINALPDMKKSDTLLLSCIHLVLVLWSVLGFAYVAEEPGNGEKRLSFLKLNGDLIVLTTLIVISGAIMTGITIGLFNLIGFKIENFYFENIVIFALPAAPILGTYLTQTNPQLVGKVSPVIAAIFSPLVLVMLVIFLAAMVYSRKDPYNDREFLIVFNALLIGVLAIIFFSVAEITNARQNQLNVSILFLLSVVTVIVNCFALSAIVFRITEWGITANRTAVLGANVLILINLLLVTWQLLRVLLKRTDLTKVRRVIALYLPVYCLWFAIVTFLFPFLFHFK